MIRHPLSFATGLLFGLGVMYAFDPKNGARRRARIADAFSSAGEEVADELAAVADEATDAATAAAAAGSAREA